MSNKQPTYTGSLTGLGECAWGGVACRRLAASPGDNVGCGGAVPHRDSTGWITRRKLEAVTAGSSTNYFFMKKNSFTDEYCNTNAGCAVTLSLIKSSLCNTTEAYGAASTFSVDPELSYFTTNEDGSNDGWTTTPFEFVTADSATNDTDKDYYLAVYLYNNESKPVACATLSEVTDEEEAEYYDNLVTSDDTSAETANEIPVGDNAGGGFLMTSACVVGVSFLLSAINFIAA